MNVNYNGNLISSTSPFIDTSNRAFRYGDSIFETILIHKGRPLYIEDHFERLLKASSYLKMKLPRQIDATYFAEAIVNLYQNGNFKNDVRIRFTLFRSGGGFYHPLKNDAEFLIECFELQNSGYQWHPSGLHCGFYNDERKSISPLSNFKTDRKSTRLNSSHVSESRMPSSA